MIENSSVLKIQVWVAAIGVVPRCVALARGELSIAPWARLEPVVEGMDLANLGPTVSASPGRMPRHSRITKVRHSRAIQIVRCFPSRRSLPEVPLSSVLA